MAGMQREQPEEGPPTRMESITGLSKLQMYDIMAQFKTLLDQNPEQARQVLVDNPELTRMLFQAQIMLGMVKPPQKMPTIQQSSSQGQQAQMVQSSNVQATQSLPSQVGLQGQATLSQSSVPVRQQNLPQGPQPPISVPSASVPSMNYQSHTNAVTPQPSVPQNKSYMNVQATPVPHPKPSQIQNLSMPPAPSQYSILPSHMSMAANQPHQPLQTPGMFNQPLQPPLPQQPRPPMQPFAQMHPQMPHSLGFQPSVAPQQLLSLPMFHSGIAPPSSYPQGQPPLPSQPPPQQLYQGGSHIGLDYNNQVGSSLQPERNPWAPGLQDMSIQGGQLPGPLTMGAGQMGAGQMSAGQMSAGIVGQLPRQPALSPDMEKALLQQVMSLTPEQINVLPPEQRLQVLQLQEMLR